MGRGLLVVTPPAGCWGILAPRRGPGGMRALPWHLDTAKKVMATEMTERGEPRTARARVPDEHGPGSGHGRAWRRDLSTRVVAASGRGEGAL